VESGSWKEKAEKKCSWIEVVSERISESGKKILAGGKKKETS